MSNFALSGKERVIHVVKIAYKCELFRNGIPDLCQEMFISS